MHRLRERSTDRPGAPGPALAWWLRGGAMVVPLCRAHHRAYDRGRLDLLPYLYLQWAIIGSPLMWSRFSLLIWDARWMLLQIIRPANGASYRRPLTLTAA